MTSSVGAMILVVKALPIPSGWLHCNGAAYSKEQFPQLFDLLSSNRQPSDPPGYFRVPNEQPIISAKAVVKLIIRAA